jgi:peptidoglycan/LPS O-acetylase OafA/YrhL
LGTPAVKVLSEPNLPFYIKFGGKFYQTPAFQMHPQNPLFAVVLFIIAFATAWLLQLKFKISFTGRRNESIDGLRGFLAISVFMHHSAIWYQYFQIGVWDAPKSNLFNLLGQASVSLFFMISAFLFVSKLLDAKERGFDWRNFFTSRIYRLVPLYYFSVGVMIVLILISTAWQLHVPFPKFLESVLNWLLFTINKTPNINQSDLTLLVNAGVVWSLPYEWLLYFSLPVISLFILKKKPSTLVLSIAAIFIIFFIIVHGVRISFILPFIAGSIAPVLSRFTKVNDKIKAPYASVAIIACLALLLLFHNAGNGFAVILLTIIFTLIALGNSIFSILKSNTLKFLGEVSYSTYLLHGFVLFITFYFVIGFEKMKMLSPGAYCNIVFLITPLVVIVSFITFYFIERPFMNIGKKRIKG